MEAQLSAMKERLQKVNEWGNTYSGVLAVVGVVLAGLYLMRRR